MKCRKCAGWTFSACVNRQLPNVLQAKSGYSQFLPHSWLNMSASPGSPYLILWTTQRFLRHLIWYPVVYTALFLQSICVKPHFTNTLVVIWKQCLFYVCIASMSLCYQCWCGSMNSWSAEHKRYRHGNFCCFHVTSPVLPLMIFRLGLFYKYVHNKSWWPCIKSINFWLRNGWMNKESTFLC